MLGELLTAIVTPFREDESKPFAIAQPVYGSGEDETWLGHETDEAPPLPLYAEVLTGELTAELEFVMTI